MAIRFFIYFLLIISIVSLFLTIDNNVHKSLKKDIALITFKNSTMYTINDEKVTRVVQSSEAIRYKTRDYIYDGTFISRVKSKTNEELTDIISADFIEKIDSEVKFEKNVKYDRNDFLTFSTDILYYDLDTKIAYNDKPFIGKYYDNLLMGSQIYIDTNEKYFKSQNTHFEIEIEKKD